MDNVQNRDIYMIFFCLMMKEMTTLALMNVNCVCSSLTPPISFKALNLTATVFFRNIIAEVGKGLLYEMYFFCVHFGTQNI
jgi:hypothetical protein